MFLKEQQYFIIYYYYNVFARKYIIAKKNLILQTLHLGNNIILIKYIMFYVAVCSEAFIYCFAGEYLSIKVIKNTYKYIEISK